MDGSQIILAVIGVVGLIVGVITIAAVIAMSGNSYR